MTLPIAIGTGGPWFEPRWAHLKPSNQAVFFFMNCCYILYSPAYDKFYIGASSEGAEHRLIKHNDKTYGATFTAFTSDWILFLEIKCDSCAMASIP